MNNDMEAIDLYLIKLMKFDLIWLSFLAHHYSSLFTIVLPHDCCYHSQRLCRQLNKNNSIRFRLLTRVMENSEVVAMVTLLKKDEQW